LKREEYERMFRHESTHWWYAGMRDICDALLEPIADRPRQVLDAGCGTGAGLLWLQQYGQVTGIDLSAEALAFCRERGLTGLVHGTVEALPFANGSFDLVTSFDVLYHQWVEDDHRALAEFHRVLRPGGYLLLRLPALPALAGRHDVAVQTRRRYRRPEVVRALQSQGFQVRRASYANSLLLPVVAAKRVAERWSQSAPSDLDATPPALAAICRGALRLEAAVIPRVSLPAGVSVIALATRP
jgi:SAM-dependent methyltransferase